MPSETLKVEQHLVCECPISYHVERRNDGHHVHVWDEQPPSLMQMCFGRCERCGLPFHTEFGEDILHRD